MCMFGGKGTDECPCAGLSSTGGKHVAFAYDCQKYPTCRAFCDKSCYNWCVSYWDTRICPQERPPPPLPVPDCSKQPTNGTCHAQAMACTLYNQLFPSLAWNTKVKNTTDAISLLKAKCQGKPDKASILIQRDVTGQRRREQVDGIGCHDESSVTSCVPNVEHEIGTNEALKYELKAGELGALAVLKALQSWLGPTAATPQAAFAFNFVETAIWIFWPQAQPHWPQNPCSDAGSQWAKCVWAQIQPFVARFVQQKIDRSIEDIWSATIQGFHDRLQQIQFVARQDSNDTYPNGSIRHMDDKVARVYFNSMYELHQSLIGAMPQYLMPHANDVEPLYLSQFASFHVIIMTTLISNSAYQDRGNRLDFQRRTMCYAKYIVDHMTHSRKKRMEAASISVKENSARRCFWSTVCKGYTWSHRDTWYNCGFDQVCSFEAGCGVGYGACAGTCYHSQPSICFGKHFENLKYQIDSMFSKWLAAVPTLLDAVTEMDGASHKNDDLFDAHNVSWACDD
eukprot:TRINITY_DN75491_c0_g1_i1.p1 TRINITY_DN75491_c0_g1~~TRINITY_DN75491_c0_g1_i1.p1  ORF type:complete len:592 (+),score=60.54 TRINITY_DN75491_c0_g1_i1:249-1778(+)